MSDLDIMAGVSDPTPGIVPAKIPVPREEPVQKAEPTVVKEAVPEPKKDVVEEKPLVKRMSIKEAVEDARSKVRKPDETKKLDAVEPVAAPDPDKKSEAPVGWTADAKGKWDSLDKDVQESILKREREVSDGFKGTGEATKRVKSIDQVVERLVPDHRTFGGADKVIENTLSWVSAFRNPNKQYAATQLLTAAQSFGILNEVRQALGAVAAPKAEEKGTIAPTTQTSVDPKIEQLEREVMSLRSATNQQELVRAKSTLDEWSKDKPHFEKVRSAMTNLFNSGTVAMDSSGMFTAKTLNEAYDAAVRLDPELYQESIANERKKIADEYDAKLKRDRQAAQVQNAKVASSSIKNAPPAAKVALNGAVNVNRKRSIRETIAAAAKEVNTR